MTQVYSNCAPQSTDRCVQVNGSLDKIVSALHYIFNVVADTDIKGYVNHYDPINFDAFYANEYGGYGSAADAPLGGGGQGAAREGAGGPRGGFDSVKKGPTTLLTGRRPEGETIVPRNVKDVIKGQENIDDEKVC